MALNVGELVHLVAVQELTEGVDASRFPKEEWTTLCTPWMSKSTDRTSETFQANQESASSVIRWVMRYRADVDPDMHDVPKRRRLLYQGRTYDITGAETIGRKQAIVFKTLAAV